MIPPRLALLLCLAECWGCSGEEHAACEESTSSLKAVTDRSKLGFSLQAALDALTPYDGPMEWRPGAEWLEQSPKDETTLLTIEVKHEAEPISDVSTRLGDAESDDPTFCRAHLRTQVQIDLASADGALQETFVAELRAYAEDFAELHGTLPAGSLRGSLSIEPAGDIDFYYTLREGLLEGTLVTAATQKGSQGTMLRAATIASWPQPAGEP